MKNRRLLLIALLSCTAQLTAVQVSHGRKGAANSRTPFLQLPEGFVQKGRTRTLNGRSFHYGTLDGKRTLVTIDKTNEVRSVLSHVPAQETYGPEPLRKRTTEFYVAGTHGPKKKVEVSHTYEAQLSGPKFNRRKQERSREIQVFVPNQGKREFYIRSRRAPLLNEHSISAGIYDLYNGGRYVGDRTYISKGDRSPAMNHDRILSKLLEKTNWLSQARAMLRQLGLP
ncbi:MAG: hypothetical protein H6707_04180 [Deltaproteobacteria bacterium]|nr:hypothetical protein [Deltaproteobacteria bacterium]